MHELSRWLARITVTDMLILVGGVYLLMGVALTMFKGLIQEAVRELEIGGLHG